MVTTVITLLVVVIVMVAGWVNIFRRVGYPGWLAVLLLIPLVNIVMFLWFAFASWPIERR